MTISEAGALGSVYRPSLAGPALSPEGLVQLLAQQLGEFDSQVSDITSALEGVNRQIKELSRKKELLQNVLTQMGDDGKIRARELTAEQREVLREQGVQLPDEYFYQKLEANGGPRGLDSTFRNADRRRIDREAIESAVEALTTESTRASSGRELAFLNLQQLVSQRANAIQLTSNLLRKLGESMDAVAGNIGR